ncbi:14544_t:CDS:1, partial [Funneliformis geosporum]
NLNGEYLSSPITKLDVSDCVDLEILKCSKNSLNFLSLFGCNSLNTLECEDNNLTS